MYMNSHARFGVRSASRVALLALAAVAFPAWPADIVNSMEFFGTAQADYIQDFNRMDPNWVSSFRPSKIAAPEGLYGSNGQAIISVKQSGFGVKGTVPIEGGEELTYKFNFDLYGVGSNAGQTTFRLQNMYGEWRGLLVGQTDTNWMDIGIFPDTIDYWGPSGMVFVRTPQIRWTVPTSMDKFSIAIETPNTDIDLGTAREIDPGLAANLKADNKYPDFTARYRAERDWGHVQLAGIARYLGYDTANTPGNNPQGNVTGWGLNLTGNIKSIGSDVVHLGYVYGHGIASYMNDGGVDVAPRCQVAGGICVAGTVSAVAVPLWGVTAYYDHYWADGFSTSFGYSETHVDNQSGQEGSAFKSGQYTSVNLLWRPVKNIMMGGEFLWGRRTNYNGVDGNDSRIQFSVQYKFSSK
jgi:hypothetical protein